ncbi:hypothetical protein FKM82_014755, partial [Ascaphus truei]
MSNGVVVTQGKIFVIAQTGSSVALPCQHDDRSYITTLWYQQKAGHGMQLIGLSTGENDSQMEQEFKNKWSLERTELLKSSLKLERAESQDAAVYFCAVS